MKSRTEPPSPSESPACGRQVETKQKRRNVTERELTPATESAGAPVSAAEGWTGLLSRVHARRPARPRCPVHTAAHDHQR